MKFAPVLAGGALGVLLLALATAKSPNPPEIKLPIDVAGVRSLEVRGGEEVSVEVSRAAAHLSYSDSTKAKVSSRRIGDRLVVDADLDDWETLEIVVPPEVGRFVIGHGSVGTKLRLERAEVLSTGDVTWNGDVRRLVLRDTSDPARHRDDGHAHKAGKVDCGCGGHPTLSVRGGSIGELRAYSPHATLNLQDADKIEVAYAWIGPKGNVSINTARKFHQVHLMEEGKAAP